MIGFLVGLAVIAAFVVGAMGLGWIYPVAIGVAIGVMSFVANIPGSQRNVELEQLSGGSGAKVHFHAALGQIFLSLCLAGFLYGIGLIVRPVFGYFTG